MKIIEKKIEDIQAYFLNKLINADYEVVRSNGYILWVRIDEKYDFILWIANGPDSLHLYYTIDDGANCVFSFIHIEFSNDDRCKIWNAQIDDINKATKEREAKNEREQYERLKAKFENIES
jgi:hypothetical protein